MIIYQYDLAGNRVGKTLENNTFTVYDYDAANQLSVISHQSSVNGTTNTLSQYQYAYDAVGNRTNKTQTGGSGFGTTAESYTYDAADQLTGVAYKTGSTTERAVNYQYDAAGNRTNLTEQLGATTNTTAYAANSDNQLTSVNTTRGGITVTGYVQPGPSSNKWYASVARARSQESGVSSQNGTFAIPGVPVTGGANALTVTVTDVSGNIATQVVNVTVVNGTTDIGYDANGNQTNHNGWAMTYDRENRLTEARSQESVVSYTYDPLGRLIRRIAGNTTNCLYYAGWQLIAEYDGTGALQKKYVYGPGIDEPIRLTSLQSPITDHYFHCDGLGSVTEITDGTGNLVESYRYDVFGTPTMYDHSAIRISQSAIGNRLLFTGRDYDPDTGWYNYRHRYYNPALGRFVQPDPIRQIGGLNLYAYVGNNVTNLRDLFGLCEQRPWYERAWNWWSDFVAPDDILPLPSESWDDYLARYQQEYYPHFAISGAFGVSGLGTLLGTTLTSGGITAAERVTSIAAERSLATTGSGNFLYIRGLHRTLLLRQVSSGLAAAGRVSSIVTVGATSYYYGSYLRAMIMYGITEH